MLTEQEPSGTVPWVLNAFAFIQDTPLGKKGTTSCERSRGSDESPLFIVNRWVDALPPPVGGNRRVQQRSYLLERIRRCERERGLPVNLIAVDHYDQGDVSAVVEQINAERARR